MNIPKAIEILQIHFGGVQPLKDPDLSKAAQLGIEALKLLENYRSKGYHPLGLLLPGESED